MPCWAQAALKTLCVWQWFIIQLVGYLGDLVIAVRERSDVREFIVCSAKQLVLTLKLKGIIEHQKSDCFYRLHNKCYRYPIKVLSFRDRNLFQTLKVLLLRKVLAFVCKDTT